MYQNAWHFVKKVKCFAIVFWGKWQLEPRFSWGGVKKALEFVSRNMSMDAKNHVVQWVQFIALPPLPSYPRKTKMSA